MAQIEENNRCKSNKYLKRKSIRVDLTPMVDLGFLLITFFILATTLSDPTIANLLLPKDSIIKIPVKANAALTLVLTRNDSIKYYEGTDQSTGISKYCTFQNLRSVIQEKQKKVAAILGNRLETVLIVYPGDQSTYKNFMEALDEIQINDIRHYFVMTAQN